MIICGGGSRDPAALPHCGCPQDAGLQVSLRLLSQAAGHQGPHQGTYQVGACLCVSDEYFPNWFDTKVHIRAHIPQKPT